MSTAVTNVEFYCHLQIKVIFEKPDHLSLHSNFPSDQERINIVLDADFFEQVN